MTTIPESATTPRPRPSRVTPAGGLSSSRGSPAGGFICVTLLGEPKGKGRPRFSRASGHAYTPEKTRTYEGALRFAAQEAMTGRLPLEGPLRVNVIASFAIPASWSRKRQEEARAGTVYPTKRPDWENIAKMLDAFNEVVWRDDAQIVAGFILKEYSDKPCLIVEVYPIVAAREAA